MEIGLVSFKVPNMNRKKIVTQREVEHQRDKLNSLLKILAPGFSLCSVRSANLRLS
jgi:hypothetical protein